ncbi:MAG: extracellular solute-binding protein [Anaerolinea sp.]|nr:extracellular solute-binding protein [Anaerolinea sp.]
MKPELEFSTLDQPSSSVCEQIERFSKATGITVHIRTVPWATGWTEMVSFALHGHAPDVSHIGATWVSSLVAMNALRPFRRSEIEALGGETAFLPASWQSTQSTAIPGTWALPWTSYTFVICYRRDLLAKAGVQEQQAFSSAANLDQTIQQLINAGIPNPWLMRSGSRHVNTLHQIAAWVWGAGGDFVTAEENPAFLRPQTIAGLKAYYQLGRFLTPETRGLEDEQVMNLFRQGQAAMIITGVDQPYSYLRGNATPEVIENLGVAPLPGIPWVGGDNLVIWRQTQDSPEREHAAVALASMLAGHDMQRQFNFNFGGPTRLDAFPFLPYAGSPITTTIEQALRKGRSHIPMKLWGRVENELTTALHSIWKQIFAGETEENAILNVLTPLDRRMRLLLSTSIGRT